MGDLLFMQFGKPFMAHDYHWPDYFVLLLFHWHSNKQLFKMDFHAGTFYYVYVMRAAFNIGLKLLQSHKSLNPARP